MTEYELDVFVDAGLEGNPAGVCICSEFLDESHMQYIAARNGYSQTAFVVQRGKNEFDLRWFTPETEDDLCGHATLATAGALSHNGHADWPTRFRTRSGDLEVHRDGTYWELSLPAWPASKLAPSPRELLEALGLDDAEVFRTRDYMVVTDSAMIVRSIEPDLDALASLEPGLGGVIVTAPGDNEVDYVSRFFAPAVGIDEDPATGSTSCTLAPYWSARLGTDLLYSRQLSERGGAMRCRLDGNRVWLGGKVKLIESK